MVKFEEKNLNFIVKQSVCTCIRRKNWKEKDTRQFSLRAQSRDKSLQLKTILNGIRNTQ